MNIYLSHGKKSNPQSTKTALLSNLSKKHGYNPIAIDYTHTFDPAERAELLLDLIKQEVTPFLLVGSSMGGFVAMLGSEHPQCEGLFLMAPALCMSHYPNVDYHPNTENIVIIHGSEDEVVPYKPVEKLALEKSYDFHLVKDGHRLTDSLEILSKKFEEFLLDT